MRIGTRVLLVFGCQLAAVVLVAAAVNDYGSFYASWSELAGSSIGTPAFALVTGLRPQNLMTAKTEAVWIPPPGMREGPQTDVSAGQGPSHALGGR